MAKLTAWFNAKSQPPSREGWYDCKECNARHYFKDGLWHRSKKSIRNGAMTVHKMHWRGLASAPLKSRLERYDPSTPRSQEESAWDTVVPVGREFGSQDFDRLTAKDQKSFKANLRRLINECKRKYATNNWTFSTEDLLDALVVQSVLGELGQDVNVTLAATFWKIYSDKLAASWMTGANSLRSARRAIFSYCRNPPGSAIKKAPSQYNRPMGGSSLRVVKAFKGEEALRALKDAGVLTESGKLSDEYSAPQFISKRDAQKQSNVFSKPMPDKPTVAQIFDFCEQLCGTQELAFGWMTGHCPALAGAPVKLMDTAEGREQVLRVIFGIYHSVYQ